ncbi:amidase [Rhizobium alvei]|uniref:Amidase n=1 Tax=Rhizobium alvei TaxID=1132659 RepID=A0ABT8YQA1_9HYPH|nr:amidase [Rhizobium alvei]MDO6965365.1 amidase [Rhizobium alvei]
MTRPADCSVTELLEAYSAGTLSPRDVMADVISRIEVSEPHLHALWAFEPERALAEAAASEARWQRGEPVGPLDGIPMTIKENIATEGVPVPLGTAATALTPAKRDAPPAARSREAGAIIFAKTTMPDYGMLSSGLSSFHALARNPWNTALNPGGSSAGAAAAGAAGYGPLHIGTDIGGSIRLPAGWCGLVGFKPSFGRIPIDPTYIGRVAGPMTRTVSDTAHLMAVLSLPDDRDPLSLPYQSLAWTNLSTELRGKRIGLWLDAGIGSDPEPEVRAAIQAAAKAFSDEGAIIEPVAPFLTRTMLDGLDRFWRTRSWSDLSRLEPERRARVLPYILAWAEGGQPLSGADVFHGFSQIEAMRDAALAATAPFDFILSPVSPMPAFPAELASPIHDPERPFEHIGFTVSANMSGQPAVSVNCGYTANGLPIGLQIIGRRYDDLGVLRMAHAYETLRGPQRPWPTFG